MKKFYLRIMTVLTALTLLVSTAMAEGSALKYADEQVLKLVYAGELDTLYVESVGATSGLGSTGPKCTEGLLSRDNYGNLVYGLADSFTVNEDNTVYTFHIRENQYWVNSKGEQMDELKAKDFVTTANHICDPDSASNSALFYQNIIKGAVDSLKGDAETLEGFVALDDYNLQITLEGPRPYFVDLAVMYVPNPTDYIAEIGDEYGREAETTWYIGSFYLSDWQPQYSRTYKRNPHYWDVENVFIERIEMIYNSEADTLAPEMYKRGDIDVIGLDISYLDAWLEDNATKDTVLPVLPNAVAYVYYYSFCYAPDFGEEYEQENYLEAINNENFRQSIAWAIDRYRAKLLTVPYDTELYLANTITPVGWCGVNGVDYTDFEPLTEITHRENWGYDPEKAIAYRDAAIEEFKAVGVTLPVKLLMPYDPDSSSAINELELIKQQIEELLGKDYIECVVEAGPSSGFTAAVRRAGKYGLMCLYNGGNVPDPAQWVVAFQAGNNWTFLDQAQGDELKPQVDAYEEMLGNAWVIGEKSEERYSAYAEAEAYLIDHALIIPYSLDMAGGYYKAGRLNPFENAIGVSATYKGMHVYEKPITREQFETLRSEYEIGRAATSSLS